jgi:hypothetical protein|tara:strand:- start:4952 stop:5710 length:759 start_codon:yes stop_codon:yes gene_type:complete
MMNYKPQYEKQSTYADGIIDYVTDTSPEVSSAKMEEIKSIVGRRTSEVNHSMQSVVDKSIKRRTPTASSSKPLPASYEKPAKDDGYTPESNSEWLALQRSIRRENSNSIVSRETPVDFDGNYDKVATAIKGIESSGGDYSARGPVIKKGIYKGQRALGAYQVMPANLPQWSKLAVGRVVTPREFLENEEIQDAVFLSQMKKSYEKFGNIEDAVSTWFTGKTVKEAGNVSDGSITAPEYLSMFRNGYNQYKEM